MSVHEGYAAVTPLHLDLTHHRALAQMTDWEPALNSALRARPRPERAPSPLSGRPAKRDVTAMRTPAKPTRKRRRR